MAENDKVKKEAKVEKVVFPEEGGVLTFLEGHEKPFPGFPHERMVGKIALIKSLIPAILKGVNNLIFKDQIKPERYSRPVREIYRLFNLLIEREKSEAHKKRWEIIRNATCSILEFDNSYRFRLQDVLKEIKIEEIEPDENTQYYMKLRTDYKFNLCQKKK